MNPDQKTILATLFGKEHLAVIITQGDEWPTGTMQAFGQTADLDLIFIMGADSEKFQNLVRRPKVTVLIDNRHSLDPGNLAITRVSIQGIAREVARGSAEWESLKPEFLAKNPFEAAFFYDDGLRMVRVKPKHISYADMGQGAFKAQL